MASISKKLGILFIVKVDICQRSTMVHSNHGPRQEHGNNKMTKRSRKCPIRLPKIQRMPKKLYFVRPSIIIFIFLESK